VRFIREVTCGHGSFGKECVVCGESDYSGKLTHQEGCIVAAVIAEAKKVITARYVDTSKGILCSDFREAVTVLEEHFGT
jgi:hypothetical protein